jgi:putative ABC transport system permease protein
MHFSGGALVKILEGVWQDLSCGLRMLRKSPGFTAVAVLTLAFGIGANSAIFSVVNAVLLRPLPYRDSGRLFMMGELTPQMEMSVSYANFQDWEKQNHAFESLGARRYSDFSLTEAGHPERIRGMMASAGYWPTLGVQPLLGRVFNPAEDRTGGPPVAVISYGLWKQRFDLNAGVLGKTLLLDNQSYAIVGVLPQDFSPGSTAQVYVPLTTLLGDLKTRDNHPGIYVVGRLKQGVTLDQARVEMNRVAADLEKQYPLTNAGHTVTITPMREWVVGDVQRPLAIILAAVGFLLLIACANVSNLTLARATARQKEISIRAALGASRSRLVRQMLTESVMLAVGGGVVGVLLAYWGVAALGGLKPSNLPRLAEIAVDGPVLVFTAGLSILTGILFGILPALRFSSNQIGDALQGTSSRTSAGREHQRARHVLVVSEFALAVVLLIAAGLLLRSFSKLLGVSPAFDPHKLLTFTVDLPAEYKGEKRIQFFDEFKRRAQAVPGVQLVSYATSLPLIGSSESGFRLPSQSQQEGFEAVDNEVGPGYFQTMHIRLRKGRLFSESDKQGSPLVTVVDEVLERKCFNGGALGKFIIRDPLPPIQIVGVVDHVATYGLTGVEPVGPQYYFSVQQIPSQYIDIATHTTEVVVRTESDPVAMVETMRKLVIALDPKQPIGTVQTMDDAVADSIAPQRFSTVLLGLFGAAALLLASVGIYGVTAYSVSQRTHEIGIRMALGAQARDVLEMVIGQGSLLVMVGIGLGLAISFVATRALASQLYGVQTSDPITFAGTAGLLAGVALLATYIPARRAMRVDPMVALRTE